MFINLVSDNKLITHYVKLLKLFPKSQSTSL